MSKRIAVFCSGGGSNFQALLDAIDAGAIDGQVVCVILSNTKAYAGERARARAIPVHVVLKKSYETPEARDEAIVEMLEPYHIDLIVFAGYLGVLGGAVVSRYAGRMMNIHPALLPSFGGRGMHGHHVHEAVLASGAKFSGATVHFVDEGTDTGPIIQQACVPVLDEDDADTLAARVLEVEHVIFPRAVADFCAGRLEVHGKRVISRA